MASDEIDPEKLKAEMEKLQKEIDAANADSEEICNDIKTNAQLKGNLAKVMSKA